MALARCVVIHADDKNYKKMLTLAFSLQFTLVDGTNIMPRTNHLYYCFASFIRENEPPKLVILTDSRLFDTSECLVYDPKNDFTTFEALYLITNKAPLDLIVNKIRREIK